MATQPETFLHSRRNSSPFSHDSRGRVQIVGGNSSAGGRTGSPVEDTRDRASCISPNSRLPAGSSRTYRNHSLRRLHRRRRGAEASKKRACPGNAALIVCLLMPSPVHVEHKLCAPVTICQGICRNAKHLFLKTLGRASSRKGSERNYLHFALDVTEPAFHRFTID